MYGIEQSSEGGGRWRPPFRLVCVVGSLGSLDACRALLARLPARLPASVRILQHRLPGSDAILLELLNRSGDLPGTSLTDGQILEPARVYVAPGRMAVTLIEGSSGGLTVGLAPDESRRPADFLLASAARVCGPAVLAVVLSGKLDDAAVGVRQVRGAGGRVLVQSPETCAAIGMPQAALSTGCADFALPPSSLGDAVTALCMAPGVSQLMRVSLASWAVPLSADALVTG